MKPIVDILQQAGMVHRGLDHPPHILNAALTVQSEWGYIPEEAVPAASID